MSADRWAGHGRGAQPCPASLSPLPCPPVPPALPCILALRCFWAGWERQRRWPGRALGLHGPDLCPQCSEGSGWDSTAEPFGDRCWRFWGCPVLQPASRKASRAESVQGQPGWGSLQPPEHTGGVLQTWGCPCHGGSCRKRRREQGVRVGFAGL